MRQGERGRTYVWVLLAVIGVSVVVQVVRGVGEFMRATATPVHTSAAAARSMAGTAPPAPWARRAERARLAVREALVDQNLAGLAVAVGADDQLVWSEGFGWANVEERVPVTADTRFRLGTASVVLTSVAAGLLIEQGALALDEPIQTYVPAFAQASAPITLRQLMAHVSGVRNDGGDEGPLFSMACDRPIEGLEPFSGGSLRFEPDTAFGYSSYGWILVSAAIEQAAGEPWHRVLRKQVFEPLGMDETRLETDDHSGQATSYFPRFSADPHYGLDLMRDLNYSCYAGASALLSTAPDLVRFGLALGRGALLQPATLGVLQTSHRLVSGSETGYGLGWDIETASIGGRDARVLGHDGDVLGGQAVSFVTVPDRGLVVAVLSNTSYADAYGVAVRVADIFAMPDDDPRR